MRYSHRDVEPEARRPKITKTTKYTYYLSSMTVRVFTDGTAAVEDSRGVKVADCENEKVAGAEAMRRMRVKVGMPA